MTPFNLWRDPWIPALFLDGTDTEISARQALEQAHLIRDVHHGEPTVAVALHRFLLALAHRLCGPVDAARWRHLWQTGLPLDRLEELGRGRWELLNEGGPRFAQDPVEGKAKPVGDMTAMAGRGAGAGMMWHPPAELTPAKAARWLLWCHTYDTGGIRTKNGGGRAMGTPTGTVGNRTHTRLLGPTLARTLLLNLTPGDQAPAGTGWWERTGAVTDRSKDQAPQGMVDYLCWPARRIRLLPDDDGMIRRVLVCAGDDLKAHPDPAVGATQQYRRAHVGINARALARTVPGLAEADDAVPAPQQLHPQVVDWMGERHTEVDEVAVEQVVLVTDKYGANITDRTARTLWHLPARALVPGTAEHGTLVQIHAMLHAAAASIDFVAYAAYPEHLQMTKQERIARAQDITDRRIQDWSPLVAPLLADLDATRIHELLTAAVEREITRVEQTPAPPGLLLRTAGVGLAAMGTARRRMEETAP